MSIYTNDTEDHWYFIIPEKHFAEYRSAVILPTSYTKHLALQLSVVDARESHYFHIVSQNYLSCPKAVITSAAYQMYTCWNFTLHCNRAYK